MASITVTQAPGRHELGAAALRAISFRLNVSVPGAAREQVEITSLAAPTIAGRGPIDARVVVRNTGNVRLDFDGRNGGALEIGTGADPGTRLPFAGELYPGRSRAFALRWEDPPVLGRFTARASVRTRGGHAARSATIWVIPWRQGGALLLVGVAGALVRRGRRRRDRLVEQPAA